MNYVRNSFFKSLILNFILFSATPTSPPIPTTSSSEATQENNAEEQEQEQEEKDTNEADEQEAEEEPITTDTDNIEVDDILGKPDHDSPRRLPDDFYYDAERIHAKPLTTDASIFPENTLSI